MMNLDYRLANHPFQMLDHAYAAGLQVGSRWTENYTPGGPYYSRIGKHPADREDRLVNEEWHRGFTAGLAEAIRGK